VVLNWQKKLFFLMAKAARFEPARVSPFAALTLGR
jgi:hypothetical protein